MTTTTVFAFRRLPLARSLGLALAAAAALALSAAPARAAGEALAAPEDFASLSLEELTNIQITSVSRRSERLVDTPAPVYVIRGAEIRRAGASTLPEALRLAPNLQVARLDARNYAVTARGFNSAFENKLLVLIDGRTVYSPLFSGVYWDAQDVVLEDVDRIEVISGPGATIWGANAVNGVINIITRRAADTQGSQVSLGGGRDVRDGSVRYGGRAGGGYYRVYGKYAQGEDSETAAGRNTQTGWRRRQAGFRYDLPGLGGDLTLQGDAYHGSLHQAGTREIETGGANLLARHTRLLSGGSELRVQAYLDHTERDQPNAFIEHLDTFDLDLQHTLRLNAANLLIWGGGYRQARDHVTNGANFAFLPGDEILAWTNIYAQDELRLAATLRLNLGLKLERNSYTGTEKLPYLSVAWDVHPDHMLWASLSRAVRVPSRIDRDFYSPAAPAVVNGVPQYTIAGGPDFVSEVARVVQAGYRGQPRPSLSYAATLYYSEYSRLRTLEPNAAGPGAVFRNQANGTSYGIELSGTWSVTPRWRLTAGYTAQHLELELAPGSQDLAGSTGLANNDPRAWSSLRSSWDLTDDLELDAGLRHVGSLPRPSVPAYTAGDIRLGWRLRRDLELSVQALNLFADGHAEFGSAAGRSSWDRQLTARVTWRF